MGGKLLNGLRVCMSSQCKGEGDESECFRIDSGVKQVYHLPLDVLLLNRGGSRSRQHSMWYIAAEHNRVKEQT